MIKCDTINKAFEPLQMCSEGENHTLIRTTCMYPSFEMVSVCVRKRGESYVISDLGEAANIAAAHGQALNEIEKRGEYEASRFGLRFVRKEVSTEITSLDWLPSAILSVANASVALCQRAVDAARDTHEREAKDELYDRLVFLRPSGEVIKEYETYGPTGRRYKIDVAAIQADKHVFFEMTTPHANSVNSRYATFSDLGRGKDGENVVVYDKPLANEDAALLQKVAVLAPMAKLGRETQFSEFLH